MNSAHSLRSFPFRIHILKTSVLAHQLLLNKLTKWEPQHVGVVKVTRVVCAVFDLLVGPLDEYGHSEPVHNPTNTEVAERQKVVHAENRPVQVEVVAA